MGIVPIYVWTHLPTADNRDGLVARSEQSVLPQVLDQRRTKFQQLQEQDPYLLDKLVNCFVSLKLFTAPQAQGTSNRQH